jgi:TRAP transporter TAXI family solute receptor
VSGSLRRAALPGAVVLTLTLALAACAPSSDPASSTPRVARLSIATGGTGGVYYVYGGALARLISESITGVEATAEVTSASVDNLKFLRDGKADIAFTLADTLKDAAEGKGAFAGRPVDLRALAVLYTNFTHVVTKKGSGITKLIDLKGRVVSMGSAGSGTETIADRTLAAAGLDPAKDIRRENLSAQASADALKDGKIDAFFWSGGLPTAAVLDLAISAPITLLDVSSVLKPLQDQYGETLYRPLSIPAGDLRVYRHRSPDLRRLERSGGPCGFRCGARVSDRQADVREEGRARRRPCRGAQPRPRHRVRRLARGLSPGRAEVLRRKRHDAREAVAGDTSVTLATRD